MCSEKELIISPNIQQLIRLQAVFFSYWVKQFSKPPVWFICLSELKSNILTWKRLIRKQPCVSLLALVSLVNWTGNQVVIYIIKYRDGLVVIVWIAAPVSAWVSLSVAVFHSVSLSCPEFLQEMEPLSSSIMQPSNHHLRHCLLSHWTFVKFP